jgi:hypothetical protein
VRCELAVYCTSPTSNRCTTLCTNLYCRLGFIVFWTCFDQMQNNLISQASSMQTNGTPNDMLSAMNQVSFDFSFAALGFVPALRRYRTGTLLRAHHVSVLRISRKSG